MERINVTEIWRTHYTNTTFTMVFANETDTKKAFNAMEAAIKEINYEDGYADLWLQDLSDSRTDDSFDFESTLCWDEFTQYIPAMLKAVAEALPSVPFTGNAKYDSVSYIEVDEFEFAFSGNSLYIKETFTGEDHGYFCPECGSFVALPWEQFESDEIQCDDCEETIKVSDLMYVPSAVTETTIIF